jgi:hypothetical protein
LYNKPGCNVVSKDFSISKNTIAVDMLLLKFNITWSTSFTHYSLSVVVCVSVATETCLPSHYHTMDSFFRLPYSGFQLLCHNI